MGTWTDEMDKLLRKLKPKHSAKEIADAVGKEFRVAVSRNAVIGRLHRLGLRSYVKGTVKPKGEKPKARHRGLNDAVLAKKIKQRANEPKIKAERFKARSAPVISKRKFITELMAMECRWPDEKQDAATGWHTFCGNRAEDGRSYCPDHALLNYSKGTRSEQSAVNAAKSIARTA